MPRTMKAFLKNYRQSPRKVRLVTDLVKGTTVSRAQAVLDHVTKRAAHPLRKLLNSAVANAGSDIDAKDLKIKNIRVDEGPTMKRQRARAQGRGMIIRKRTSRIALELEQEKPKEKKS